MQLEDDVETHDIYGRHLAYVPDEPPSDRHHARIADLYAFGTESEAVA